MTKQATSVLLVASPRMVRDALARAMHEAGFARVRVRARAGESFAAAVVTGALPAGVTAGVVLRIPEGRLGPSWRIEVVVDDRRRPSRTVDGLRGLLALLDAYVPSARRHARTFDLFTDARFRKSS
jgi:hypothetical protein